MKELIAASKTDKNLRADAIKLMQTDKEYLGLNLTGDPTLGLDENGVGGMSAITDSAKHSGGAAVNKLGLRQGAAMMLSQAMGLDEDTKTSLLTSIAKGQAPDLSAFAPGAYEPAFWGKKANFGTGLDRMMMMTGRIGMATGDEMKALGSLNEGGQMVNAIDAEMAELQKAKKAGKETVSLKNAAGESNDAKISDIEKQLKAAKRKLTNQAVEDGGGTTTTEIVVHGDIRVTGRVRPETE